MSCDQSDVSADQGTPRIDRKHQKLEGVSPEPSDSVVCQHLNSDIQPPEAGLKLNIQKTKAMASGPITSWQIDGETVETVSDFIFWAPKSLQMVTAAMKLKDACSQELGKNYDKPRQHIKKQRYDFANKGPSSQGYGFSSDHVWL